MTAPRRAFIVIDAQQEYFEELLPIQFPAGEDSVTSIQAAIDVAQHTDTTGVLVQHEPPAKAPVFAAKSST